MLGRVSPVTRVTLPACRAHYPGGPRRVRLSVASPPRAAFPEIQAGRRPRLLFRGLLRLHSRYGPSDRSAARGGLRHEASACPVDRADRSSAARSNRQLSGWILPPLVTRAIWAHWIIRASPNAVHFTLRVASLVGRPAASRSPFSGRPWLAAACACASGGRPGTSSRRAPSPGGASASAPRRWSA